MSPTYINSQGKTLSTSEAFTKGYLATSKGTFSGTVGNDGIRSGGSGTLSGGLGDDTYFVYSQKDVVIEKAKAGIDTIISSSSYYVLPDNVENLTVNGANTSGTGNSLDNIIKAAGTGSQTLNGGGGNDVLIGGSGNDTFVVAKGEGSDVVIGFDIAKDVIQLNNFPALDSFSNVRAAMIQVGADTIVKLDGAETLTLRNHKIADFTPENFRLPIDMSKFGLTFSDEFNSFSGSATGTSTTWMTKFPYGGIDARTLTNNHEKEYYSDSSVGVNPFSISNGVLDITATRAQEGVQTPAGSGLDWTSGMISTYKSFSQLYGYFEVRAQLPAGQGLWPAFWLLPADNSWPPELDIFEVLGNDPGTLYASTHSKAGGSRVTSTQTIAGIDTSKGFHTYGVNWQADTITWYIDNNAVAQAATPRDMQKPMYMLLNLAVGGKGSWPGATDATTPDGHMLIDYVRAYAARPASLETATPTNSVMIVPDLKLARIDKGAGSGVNASLAGTAAAGATVSIYDGTTLVAAIHADDRTGAFSLAVNGLGAGKHVLSAKVGSTAVTANLAVVVGTAAEIATQLPALQASGKLAAIYLTDTHVIPVASAAAMTSLIAGSKDALAAIQGGYSFSVTATSGTSGTNKTFTSYDSTGRLIAQTTSNYVDGKIARSVETKADGSSTVLVYTNGIAVSETVFHADKTKDVQLSNIIGKSYVAEHSSYDAAGTLLSSVRTHADGSQDWSYTLDKQSGVKTTTSYDTTGAMTERTVSSSIGTVESTYVGSVITSEYTHFAAGSADKSSIKLFTSGILSRETVRHSDGTSESYAYGLQDKSYVARHDTLDSSGKVMVTDLTQKDGSHTITGIRANVSLVSSENASDTLKGLGGDTFVFQTHSGADTVVGFHVGGGAGHDVIAIDRAVATQMADLVLTTVGHDTIIHLSATDTITLQGVNAAALTHDNFWFH